MASGSTETAAQQRPSPLERTRHEGRAARRGSAGTAVDVASWGRRRCTARRDGMNAISQTSAGRLSPKSRQKNPNHTKGAQLRFCSATVTSERSPLLINIGHWQASLHTQATTYPDRSSAMHRRTTDRLTRLLASVSARPEDRQSMGSAPPPHQLLGSTAMDEQVCCIVSPPVLCDKIIQLLITIGDVHPSPFAREPRGSASSAQILTP